MSFFAEEKEIASKYNAAFSTWESQLRIVTDNHDSRVYYTYVMQVERRDELKEFLTQRGIETQIYYPLALPLQPAFSYLGYQAGDFPKAEMFTRKSVVIPLYPEMPDEHVDHVIEAVTSFCSKVTIHVWNMLDIPLSGLSDEAGLSLELQIQAHLELGWNEIELRSADGIAFSNWKPAYFKQASRVIKDANLRVTAVASRIANWERPITGPFETDMEELRRAAERMQALGASYIRVMSYPNDNLQESEWKKRVFERFHMLTDAAIEEGIVLLHENCSGWAGTRAENALELVEEINSPHLRLLFAQETELPITITPTNI